MPRLRSSRGDSAAGLGLAVLAVLCFSTSAVFVRLAAPLSPYEITFWRMLVAAAMAGGGMVLLGSRRAGKLPGDRRYVLFGLVAALHFLFYVASLSFTSIADSLSITYTAPILIALGSSWLLGERLSPRQWIGITLAVVGVAVLAGFDPHATQRMLFGDGLALLSALCFAAYSIAGRAERTRCRLLPYATSVYGTAAVWLLPALAAGLLGIGRAGGSPGIMAAYTPRAVLAVAAAGILPLGFGHTLYNASLRRIPATYANIVASQEVTGGIILGVLLLGEVPAAISLVGVAITLAGIILVLI
ncbi:MAG: DMT family transporter [Chloroflexota bacterium]